MSPRRGVYRGGWWVGVVARDIPAASHQLSAWEFPCFNKAEMSGISKPESLIPCSEKFDPRVDENPCPARQGGWLLQAPATRTRQVFLQRATPIIAETLRKHPMYNKIKCGYLRAIWAIPIAFGKNFGSPDDSETEKELEVNWKVHFNNRKLTMFPLDNVSPMFPLGEKSIGCLM